MPELHFRLLNVFTSGRPLSGNPLCVFEDARGLDDLTMQALARQLNLSETTFILPSAAHAARVRIFTPSYEMPFAGHPTLGTAHVCRALGLGGDELALEVPAGLIPVRAEGNRWTLTIENEGWRECEASRAALAGMLGIGVEDIGERPLWVKAGKEQLIVPLASERAVRAVRPDASRFSAVRSEEGHSMAYVFGPRDEPGRLLSRFFFPDGSAILEDPATGSAAANLGGWLLATGHELPCTFEISQGEYTGRPSELTLHVDAARQIRVAGEVIDIGRGTLCL